MEKLLFSDSHFLKKKSVYRMKTYKSHFFERKTITYTSHKLLNVHVLNLKVSFWY